MISIATKLSRIARKTQIAFSLYNSPPHFLSLQSSPHSRFFSTNQKFKVDPAALLTIYAAKSIARSLQTDDSYAQGILKLEQCESNLTDESSKGLVLLAMSKLLSERGNNFDAKMKIEEIMKLNIQSIHEGVHIAVTEAYIGLYLEAGLDDDVLQALDDVLLCGSSREEWEAQWRTLKGLCELVRGNPESSESYFELARDIISSSAQYSQCLFTSYNSVLSYAELLHTMRNFSLAKELYQTVIQGVPENEEFCDPDNLTDQNIALLPFAEDISLAATCALGQLEAHMGNFADSKEILAQALIKAEELYGPNHPKFGIVLTCLFLMNRYIATVEQSSSLKIPEALYKRAMEVLLAPPLETAVAETPPRRRDIIALARGAYGETLCVQQNRKAEGERIKSWAESAWSNRRLSLAEALDISEPSSKVPVIDLRISRVL